MERNARLDIESGVTTVREMPDYFDSSFRLKDAIDQGYVAGPKMVVSGRAIAQTGGYFGWPAFGHLVTTPKQAQIAIAANLEEGAGFIVVPTPDSTLLKVGERDIAESTLDGAVDYARSRDVDITAHIMWANGASLAVEKGVTGLEHMPSIMDPLKKSLADTILRESIYVIPTIFMYTNFDEIANDPEAIKNPEYERRFGGSYKIASNYAEKYNGLTAAEDPDIQKSKQVLDKAVTEYFKKNFQRMAKSGATIGVGTGAGDMLMPHGWISKELEKYVEYGVSPTEALVAATYTNAFILKREKEIGRIKAGYVADLLMVEGDPTVNIQDIENVIMVLKDGVEVFKK
jgi:imidazolonepropionase-like amidohydrolase